MDPIPDKYIPDVDSRRYYMYLAYAIVATILTLIVLLLIVAMRKRIDLVIQLFKESAKAIAAMPLLLFQPVFVKQKFKKNNSITNRNFCRLLLHLQLC